MVVAVSRIAPRPTHVDRDPDRGYQIRYNRHPKRQNNFKVGEMYDCYKDGMSLATVAGLYGCTRQSVYDIFSKRGYPLRTKRMRGLQVLDGINFTLTKGGHLRGTVAGRRILMHWYVWEKANGPVPEGYCILHKDLNPANNALENLDILPKVEMPIRFNPEKKRDDAKAWAARRAKKKAALKLAQEGVDSGDDEPEGVL